jgi:hypothetical protein
MVTLVLGPLAAAAPMPLRSSARLHAASAETEATICSTRRRVVIVVLPFPPVHPTPLRSRGTRIYRHNGGWRENL